MISCVYIDSKSDAEMVLAPLVVHQQIDFICSLADQGDKVSIATVPAATIEINFCGVKWCLHFHS
jgi:hypothetical protein